MVRPGRDRLKGCVEVDETCVGGPEEGSRGRQTEEKSIVAVAAEEDGDRIGRIRLGRVPDVSAASLFAFIHQAIVEGSVIHTDGWLGYHGLEEKGYGHRVSNIKCSGGRPHELMPRVHRVPSQMKRWPLGTHQGSVSPVG
jgi:transposase-like protein